MAPSQKTKILNQEQRVEKDPIVAQEKIFLPSVEEVMALFSKIRIDIVDINILRAFYLTGKQPPLDTVPWCFPILYKGFKEKNITQAGSHGFYLKVEKLRKAGLIKKLKRTSPALYEPDDVIKYVIRRSVLMWLANRGLKVSSEK